MEKKGPVSFCVYCHINKSNGKKYFGITSQPVERRWRCGLGYKKGAFHNAIDKYGWDGFRHEIIADNLSEDEAKRIEIEQIKLHKTNIKSHGYNITAGGDGTIGYKRPPEQIKAMSESRKGRHAGSKNPMYGKSGPLAPHYGVSMSEEAKRKAGEQIHKRHQDGAYTSLYKPVLAERENETLFFYSIAEAERKTGIAGSMISRVCKGKRKHAGGYSWRYLSAEEIDSSNNGD